MTDTHLEPCPFCGGQARRSKGGDGETYPIHAVTVWRHGGDKCRMEPQP